MELESTISQVTVFRAGAVITRSAKLSAAGDDVEIAFSGLPTVLDDASVRVRLTTGKETTLPTDVRVELVLPPAGESILDDDQEKLAAAAQALHELRTLRDRIEQEIQAFSTLTPVLTPAEQGKRPLPAATAAWRETLGWQRQETEQRHAEIAALDKRIKAADEERARFERSIRQTRAERDSRAARVSKRVVFIATGHVSAGVEATIEYRVPGARWAPSYVVRVARDGKTAELGLRALVAQNTGEKWTRVKLSLSTAELLRAQDIPELKSLRIGRVLPPSGRPAWREPPGDTDRLFAALDAAVGRNPTPPRATAEIMTTLHNPNSTKTGGGGANVGMLAAMAQEIPSFDAKPIAPPVTTTVMAPPGMGPMMPAASAPMNRPSPPPPPMGAPPMQPQPMRGVAREASPKGMAMAGGMVADGKMMDMLVSADEEPQNEAAAAAVVYALKQLRYAELKVMDFRSDDRGKLRPLNDRDRVGEHDTTIVARVVQQIAGAAQNAARADARIFGVSLTQSAGAYDYRYDSDGVVDVPSDGEIHNVSLLKRRAEMRSVYVAVPRESTDVVRIASMKNPLQAPLLAGDTEVYLDDEFLVGTQLRTVPAGGEVTIGLGVEQAVKVARRVKYEEETEGFLRGGRALDHAIEIEIASRLKSPIEVDVRERVPMVSPGEKNVEVEIKRVEPQWEPFEQRETASIHGGHRWRFSLDGGQKKILSFAYCVKIEAKAELSGGNRREPY